MSWDIYLWTGATAPLWFDKDLVLGPHSEVEPGRAAGSLFRRGLDMELWFLVVGRRIELDPPDVEGRLRDERLEV